MSRMGFEMRNSKRDVRWELGLRAQRSPARHPISVILTIERVPLGLRIALSATGLRGAAAPRAGHAMGIRPADSRSCEAPHRGPTYHWMRQKSPSHTAYGGWFVCCFVSDGGVDVERGRLNCPQTEEKRKKKGRHDSASPVMPHQSHQSRNRLVPQSEQSEHLRC